MGILNKRLGIIGSEIDDVVYFFFDPSGHLDPLMMLSLNLILIYVYVSK